MLRGYVSGIRVLVAAAAVSAGCAQVPASETRLPVAAAGCELLLDPDRSTFVIHEVNSGRTLTCNEERAVTRFTPASTFKIAHALVALETGVVTDENALFEWDGRARGVSAWDRPTSLAGGIPASTVWVFQSIASLIGHDLEQAWLKRLSYGNAEAGGAEDLRSFWLSGPLAISAMEQVGFLARLRMGALDASPANQARVGAMLHLRDCGPECRVFGKTGAVLSIDRDGFLHAGGTEFLPPGERTGWFVGWVERDDAAGGPVVFAHNLDLSLPGAMAARTGVAYAVLEANGISTGTR